MKTRLSLPFGLALLLGALLAAFPRQAYALPAVGASLPHIRLVDAWGRTLDVARVGGQPLLVIYEDQGSSTQNAVLKDELSELAKGDRYEGRIALAAIADVAGYDHWPARGFVKNAIRDESNKAGTPIYCDWSGGARTAFGVRKGMSTVILYDRRGQVLFAHEGTMPAAARDRLFDLLRVQLAR